MIWQVVCVLLTLGLGVSTYAIIHSRKSFKQLKTDMSKIKRDMFNYPILNPHPVIDVDKMGVITFANHGSEVLLTEWKIGLNEKIPPEWREVVRQVVMSNEVQTIEMACAEKSYFITIVPRRGDNASIFGVDITTLKNTQKALEEQSLIDEQTKLLNRISFKKELAAKSEQAISSKSKLGVMIIRLDDYFQVVNTYGQETANQILLEFSERLVEFTHKQSTIARLSENQFGLLEPHLGEPAAMAAYVQSLIEQCILPYKIADREIFINISIGISFCPNDGVTPEILSRNAQLAVNRTSSSRNQYEFFQRGMEEQLQLKRDVIADVHKALERNEFQLYYQPQIHLGLKKLVGCESLIRWKHPEKGYISPFFFITAAEESQLIVQIGEWTLREACRQIVKWREQGLPPIKVAVNLSARQVLKSNVVDLVHKVMLENNITSDWLSLELTESALVQDKDQAAQILKSLKTLNLDIALDDFGTGYSSLSYLMQFPIDKLKIDQSFVKTIEDEKSSNPVIKGIIDLGHSMNLHLIAEGVETTPQLLFLKQNGCEMIQGYIFGQAQPADKFVKYFKTDWKATIDKHLSD